MSLSSYFASLLGIHQEVKKDLSNFKRDQCTVEKENNNEHVNACKECNIDLRKNIEKDTTGFKLLIWEMGSICLRKRDLPVVDKFQPPEWKQDGCVNVVQNLHAETSPVVLETLSEKIDRKQENECKQGKSSHKIEFEVIDATIRSTGSRDYSYPSKGRGSLHAIRLILLAMLMTSASAATDRPNDFLAGVTLPCGFWYTLFVGLIVAIVLKLCFHKMCQLVEECIGLLMDHLYHPAPGITSQSASSNSVGHSSDQSMAVGDNTYISSFTPPNSVENNKAPIKQTLVSERHKRREANQFDHSSVSPILVPDAPCAVKDPGRTSIAKKPVNSNDSPLTSSSSQHAGTKESTVGRESSATIMSGSGQLFHMKCCSVSPALNILIPHVFKSAADSKPQADITTMNSSNCLTPSSPHTATPVQCTTHSLTVGIGGIPKTFNCLGGESGFLCSSLTVMAAQDANDDSRSTPPRNNRHVIPFN